MIQPRRNVPLLTKAVLCCSDTISQFGWVFFGFGMIFVWLFSVDGIREYSKFRGGTNTIEARILKTNKRTHEGSIVGYYTYQYSLPSEDIFHGSGYVDGQKRPIDSYLTIEYLLDEPSESRLRDSTESLSKLLPLLMPIVFPIAGLVLLFPGINRGLQSVKALKHGELANAELAAKKHTSVSVNKRPVYEYIFEFSGTNNITYTTSTKTHIAEKYHDKNGFQVCYLRTNPLEAVMLDALPQDIVDEIDGDLIISMPFKSLYLLVAPVTSIVLHGYFIPIRIFGS